MIQLKNLNPLPTIFSEMEKINPDCKIFVLCNGSDLDDLYLAMYGGRFTTDNLDSAKTAKYINMLYAKNWDNAFNLFNASGEIMGELGATKSTTITRDNDYTDTSKDTDNVPTYDSTELSIEKSNDRSFNHKVNTDTETTIEDSKNINNFNVSFEYLLKNLICDIVFTNVNDFATVSIQY